MAYPSSCSWCPAIQQFSTPGNTHLGMPTGAAGQDVRGTLDSSYPIIAAFRESLVPACDDADGDGVCDESDNCSEIANGSQHDADADGYGDACDADYNGDGTTGTPDYQLFAQAFGSSAGDANFDARFDHNGDGVIGTPDYTQFAQSFGLPPGPSGLACAGTPQCTAP